MGAILARICVLERLANGRPKMSQFLDVQKGTALINGFSIGYGGTNPNWPGGGYRPRYLAWHHSNIDNDTGLYALFFGRGPDGARLDWVEDSPRDGLPGYQYCAQGTHLWRWFRCTGLNTSLPPEEQYFTNRYYQFPVQPPAPSTVSESTPWLIGDYEVWELIPSIPVTIAGFDLPAYASAYDDEQNGDELD